MFKNFMKFATALVFGLLLDNAADAQSPHAFIYEIYSNADGTVQFFQFNGSVFAGNTLVASNGVTEHSFTFDAGAPICPGYLYAGCLVGTQGFADLTGVKPDFVVPNGFLFLAGHQSLLYVSISNPPQTKSQFIRIASRQHAPHYGFSTRPSCSRHSRTFMHRLQDIRRPTVAARHHVAVFS
jgi:hypothetical protein